MSELSVEDRLLIMSAIERIHFDAQYFKGMDILCQMVGWPSLRNEFDDKAERRAVRKRFNDWIRRQRI